MAQLLLEVLSEEIPARMQARAADDLARLTGERLTQAGLSFTSAEAHVTPRRLALVVEGLPVTQADVREERRGPRVDAPAKAIEGFLRGAGVRREDCEERDTGKGRFLFAVIDKPGQATGDALPEILGSALAALPWPKSMRWGDGTLRWVRPLHSLIALFDGHIIDLRFGAISAGNTTCGHRFMAPAAFTVADFATYQQGLAAAFVLLDRTARRQRIAESAQALAKAEGLALRRDDALLEEVTGLVEWPVALIGRIDDAFMDVPTEVLTTAMRAHQKYFSCLDASGALAPRFVVIANRQAADGDNSAIVAGNERVLRARLSDAKFFWDQDRRHTLESRTAKLADIVFHAKLGDMAQKSQRLVGLVGHLASHIPQCDAALAGRAAHLAKADLVTDMVFEFPELQGIMGRYYAHHDGEPEAVADAIAEHYAPQGPGDTCPSAPVAVALALADKLDTLAGFWTIDEKPTGSKDPFALRRAALGVIRLIMENQLRLPLLQAFGWALAGHGCTGATAAAVAADLLDFFADRLKVHLREQGVRHDLIAAVFALRDDTGGAEDDLLRLLARVAALSDFLASDDGGNLLIASRRASNIVRIEEKKDGIPYDGATDHNLLQQAQERDLATQLDAVVPDITAALTAERFAEAMAGLASLRRPVDAFFDQVTVNCDDTALRANRLRLLSRIRMALGQVADFTLIEG